ncbi:MAG: hypothetical protein ACRCS8_05385 [Brevinema sp.]
MRKLALLAMLVLSTNVFAQGNDATPAEIKHGLTFYLDTFSGQLNSNNKDGKLFSGNEFEFGVSYSQNFSTVPWLGFWTKALVVTGINPNYTRDGAWAGSGSYVVYGYGMPRVQLGLAFGDYGYLAVDTRGLMAVGASYGMKFADIHSVTVGTDLEFWMIPFSGYGRGNVDTDGDGEPNSAIAQGGFEFIDLFQVYAQYSVALGKGWGYKTSAKFRFGGNDSAKAFGESFAFRWENQVSWAALNGFGLWGQVRYHVKPFAPTADMHNVYLQAGLWYSFDLGVKK